MTKTLCARELYDWICENPNAAGVEIERLKGLISLAYHDEGTSLSENTFSIFRDELKGFSPKAPSHEPNPQPFKITASCECGRIHSAMSNQPFKMLGIMCPCGKVTPFVRDAEKSPEVPK